ncbi:ribonuclease H-like domain-containing protein [Tanacetum coccineum]
MRARRYFQRTGKKITINGSDTTRYDKSKVECFNCHKMGHFARECRGPRNKDNMNMNEDNSRRTVNVEKTSSKAMVAIDGADTSFKDSEINALKSEIKKLKKEKESNQIKIDKFENASKSLDKLIRSQISDNSRKGVGFEFQQPEFKGYRPKTSKSVCKDTSNEVKKTTDAPLGEKLVSEKEKQTIFPIKIEFVKQQEKPARKPVKLTAITIKEKRWNMTPKAVLMKTGLKPLNTARPVNIAHPKTLVYRARPMFLEDKPIIAGDGPKWLFDINVLTKSMNYVPVVAGTNSNDSVAKVNVKLFDSSSKDASNDEPQPSNDVGKKDDEGGIDDQERTEHSAQDINTARPSINTASINFNTGSLNINIVSPTVPTAPLESTYADFFGDESE